MHVVLLYCIVAAEVVLVVVVSSVASAHLLASVAAMHALTTAMTAVIYALAHEHDAAVLAAVVRAAAHGEVILTLRMIAATIIDIRVRL